MKKLAYSLLFVMILTLSIFLFVSCGEDEQETPLAQVNVKFMIGDTVYKEAVMTEGDSIEDPGIKEYGAYSISYWTVNNTSKFAVFPYTVGKSDITFKANTTRLIKVSFYSDGEKLYAEDYKTSEKVYAIESPEKEGYKFMGWEYNDELVKFPYSLKTFEEDELRFEAIFEKLSKVECYAFGEQLSSGYYINGITISLPEEPKVSGYTFLYWQDEKGNRITDKSLIDGDMYISAIFEKNLYTVNYYIGSSAKPYKTLYVSSKALELKYEGDGVFYGWYTTSSYATKYDFTKTLSSDIDLYGKVYTSDYSILRSYGSTQKASINTTVFSSLAFDTTYPTTVTISVASNKVKATYSFTTTDKKKGTIVYDMFAGTITGTYGTNEAGISITVDKYNYQEINLSNYIYTETVVTEVSGKYNPSLKTIALKVAEVTYNYIHNEYNSAKTEVVTTGIADPEKTYTVSVTKSGKTINMSSNETFYSVKLFNEDSLEYMYYAQNSKSVSVSNLIAGDYVVTFAFDQTIDGNRIRQYINVSISI